MKEDRGQLARFSQEAIWRGQIILLGLEPTYQGTSRINAVARARGPGTPAGTFRIFRRERRPPRGRRMRERMCRRRQRRRIFWMIPFLFSLLHETTCLAQNAPRERGGPHRKTRRGRRYPTCPPLQQISGKGTGKGLGDGTDDASVIRSRP